MNNPFVGHFKLPDKKGGPNKPEFGMMDYRATCGYLPHFSQFTQAPLVAPTHGKW